MSNLRRLLLNTNGIMALLILMGNSLIAADAPTPYDCGFLALYNILRLEGCATDIERLETVLPSPRPDGYSMRELRDAAKACGLELDGVTYSSEKKKSPDRPMLVFIKRNGHGHFIVVRPVGHTGKLVQIFDGFRPLEVIDAINLYKSTEWTGLALLPRRANWTAYIVCTIVAGAAPFIVYRRFHIKKY